MVQGRMGRKRGGCVSILAGVEGVFRRCWPPLQTFEIIMTPYYKNLTTLSREAHQTAVEKGFWASRSTDDIHSSLAEMALIHSEVSEASEALRMGNISNFAEELADIVIRVMDSAAARGFDLQNHVLVKMEKNATREYLHGKRA